MEDNKVGLIESLFNNNKSGSKSIEKYIQKYFPFEYHNIVEFNVNKENSQTWLEKLYNYINNLEELPKCSVCGGTVKFKNIRKGYYNHCSMSCLNKCEIKKAKTIITNIKKFGCENPSQNIDIRKKTISTNLIRYGCENVLKNSIVKEKTKRTNLKKYGCENPSQFDEFKDKRKMTFMDKYGVEHVFQSPEIYNKMKNTNKLKYGEEFYSKTKECKDRIKQTSQIKYNKDSYLQTDDYHVKTKQTNLKKYGNEKLYLSEDHKIKILANNLLKRKKLFSNMLGLSVENIEMCNNVITVKNYCKLHSEFIISEKNIYNRIRLKHENVCTICNPVSETTSIVEKEIKNYVNNELHVEANKIKINRKEIDIYIEKFKLGVELNGIYWHSNKRRDENHLVLKTELCEANEIKLLHVFDSEWRNKKGIVKSIIKSNLGIFDQQINSDDCKIVIINKDVAENFIYNNHIEEYSCSDVNIGLKFNDELISMMTFSSKNNCNYELLRFCVKLNIDLFDGFSKMLKYFINNNQPKIITTNINRRYFNGELCIQSGFEFIENTKPDYYYFKHHTTKLESKSNFLDVINSTQKINPNKTEFEIMDELGYLRIYDCGRAKFELKLE